MISPQEKLRLMRTYEVNPSAAILMLADLLRRDVEGTIAERCATMMVSMKAEMPDLQAVLAAVRGSDGKDGLDASPEDIAKVLLSNSTFLAAVKGEKGDEGKSIEGPVGPQGASGKDGRPGADGRDGKPGPEGPEGRQGTPGTAGKDGSPDKPEEIAAKLNQTEESVDVSVIKGLRKWMASIQIIAREKKGSGGAAGGGMGTTVHKSFSLTSATTTVTLDSAIAAGGFAIMGAYYEGGFVVRGVGYSVGADRKTLTLLFTPEDSTHLDVVYIRS